MKPINFKYFACDFETTVYDGQKITQVWAAACVQLYSNEKPLIFHSIESQFEYLKELNCNVCCYYHNLKFDGNFWLYYIITKLKYDLAIVKINDELKFLKNKDMKNNTFKYSITNMGYWYTITLKVNNHIIEIRDSLKLLPFTLRQIGESFDTKHKKLEMEYKGIRYPGCVITEEEKHYIENDVLVLKEALEIMFNEGHNKLTIGSCCLAEFKNLIKRENYNRLFPDLYEIKSNSEIETAGDYIRKSYRGGWCYLVKGKENKMYRNGITLDVNSLYPSVMHSSSGNKYPVGVPTFWNGNYIPEEAKNKYRYFFIRIRTRFYLKEGKLPFIQIKNNLLYKPTESLETSDIYNTKDGKYYKEYIDREGNIKQAIVELTLTMTDYELLKEHYTLKDFEILGGCYFRAIIGIFDIYIDKYKKIKQENKGAKRQLAKLFLNNLYGKMASSKNSSFKVAYINDENAISFYNVSANDKKPGYIAIGSAITSYARNFTIRAAQKNFYGKDKKGFIYADTDSIHCDLPIQNIKGVNLHDTDFNCWKCESKWNTGFFIRQKTYIEIANTIDIKCAGMPEKCKKLFILSTKNEYNEEEKHFIETLSEEEKQFINDKKTISDFKRGLIVPGKLLPKRIKGGVILKDITYEIR